MFNFVNGDTRAHVDLLGDLYEVAEVGVGSRSGLKRPLFAAAMHKVTDHNPVAFPFDALPGLVGSGIHHLPVLPGMVGYWMGVLLTCSKAKSQLEQMITICGAEASVAAVREEDYGYPVAAGERSRPVFLPAIEDHGLTATNAEVLRRYGLEVTPCEVPVYEHS